MSGWNFQVRKTLRVIPTFELLRYSTRSVLVGPGYTAEPQRSNNNPQPDQQHPKPQGANDLYLWFADYPTYQKEGDYDCQSD